MSLFKCPVPGCTHIAQVILNSHFKSVHNMTRKEAVSKFGIEKWMNR